MFEKLLSVIQSQIVGTIYKVGITQKAESPIHPALAEQGGVKRQDQRQISGKKRSASVQPSQILQGKTKAGKRSKKKIGRNEPCPCGSGKKYKKCCLPKYG